MPQTIHTLLIQYLSEIQKIYGAHLKMRDSIRFLCQRRLYTRFRHRYNDSGRCNMWLDISMPENVENCDNYLPNV